MVGGGAENFKKVETVFACYASYVKRLGEAGAGQLSKMANQICIAGIVQSLAEALHFAKLSQVDPREVIDVISKGAAQSWQMENRYETMIDGKFEFGFAVDWMKRGAWAPIFL
jgi:3-hydroxyisobutyrate dehydrogenase-like beta-hydroxyacid dehydrogenase